MAHFYGRVQGGRSEATRCGTKRSGFESVAASWEGAVHTRLWHDEVSGWDMCEVTLQPWHGAGVHRLLYSGRVNGGNK